MYVLSTSRWVFNRGPTSSLNLFKVIGDTVDGAFYIYDCKNVPLRGEQLGAYTIQEGLYSTEGGGRWAQFLHLRRPPCEAKSQAPHLHMYRCLQVPEDVMNLITAQTFANLQGDRSERKWIRKGASSDNFDGWVWSNGDGWYWTEKRGYHRLIRAHGEHQ